MDVGVYTLLPEEDLYELLEETFRMQNEDFDQGMGPNSDAPLPATGGPSQPILQHMDAVGQLLDGGRNRAFLDAYMFARRSAMGRSCVDVYLNCKRFAHSAEAVK